MDEKRKTFLLVTVARTMGSGGSFVGQKLAARLGCLYLDREILLQAAQRMHRDPETLEAFDERHLSFWERTGMAYTCGAPDAPYAPPPVTAEDMDLFDAEKAIIREAAVRGPAVIVGRAAFALLAGEPGHLSVFLHAPLEHRVARIQKVYGLATAEEARELVTRSDKDRAHFVKAAAGVDWLDPRNYHLAVDTGRLGTGAALELVFAAAKEAERRLQRPGDEPA